MKTRTIGMAGVALVAVSAVAVAVWASFWTAPWETEQGNDLTEAEVIGLVAQEASITVDALLPLNDCHPDAMFWEAASTGNGMWQVGAYCITLVGVELPYSNPEDKGFPLWSFREGTGQIIPLNSAAVKASP